MSERLIPTAYRVAGQSDEVQVVCRGLCWAVVRGGWCLNREGEWEHEPRPSERDDAFLVRCRFNTPEKALAAVDLALAGGAVTLDDGGRELGD